MSGEKRPVGRPCELNEQVIECAWAYLKGGWREQGNAVPSVAGLAFALGKSRNAVYEWAEQSTELNDILNGIATAQEMLLIDGGLMGDLNPTITKMMMTKHGYSDKVDSNLTNSDGSLKPAPAMTAAQFADIAREVLKEI